MRLTTSGSAFVHSDLKCVHTASPPVMNLSSGTSQIILELSPCSEYSPVLPSFLSVVHFHGGLPLWRVWVLGENTWD